MWAILKFDRKKLSLLEKDLKQKLGKDIKIYIPKLRIQKYRNNKLINKPKSRGEALEILKKLNSNTKVNYNKKKFINLIEKENLKINPKRIDLEIICL